MLGGDDDAFAILGGVRGDAVCAEERLVEGPHLERFGVGGEGMCEEKEGATAGV